jgi:phosphoribosylglycinamide formyltransferase-1
MARTKLGILISGRGSNMMAIAAACDAGVVPAEVAIVISNRADAPGIGWAREHGLATAVLPQRDFSDREAHDRAIVDRLHQAGVEWVCLAGYMRLLSRPFIASFPCRILTSIQLLPSFPASTASRCTRWEVRFRPHCIWSTSSRPRTDHCPTDGAGRGH